VREVERYSRMNGSIAKAVCNDGMKTVLALHLATKCLQRAAGLTLCALFPVQVSKSAHFDNFFRSTVENST
jgi:hypothetical protein